MLISRLLFSSEVWLRVKKDQIKKLADIDELYLVRILGLKQTVAKEGLYLETGKYPVSFIVKQRRLMYFWFLLNKADRVLTSRVLNAQILKTEKYDWYELVLSDRKELNIDLSDNGIKCMPKGKFKQY